MHYTLVQFISIQYGGGATPVICFPQLEYGVPSFVNPGAGYLLRRRGLGAGGDTIFLV